jgi:hypothetical protein
VLIAHRYPSSSAIRAAVSSVEAVRYSLDPLTISGVSSEANRNFLVLLAAYFSGRQALADYANNVLAVLRDDKRLQTMNVCNCFCACWRAFEDHVPPLP